MANAYQNMTDAQLDAAIADLEAQAADLRALNLKLDMARGKPSPEQTALSKPMLDLLTSESDLSDQGVDADNYGAPDGLPSARALAAELLGVDAPSRRSSSAWTRPTSPSSAPRASTSCTTAWSTATSTASAATSYVHGIGGNEPWCKQGVVKFLCPAPGYDRHFTVTESFGIQNVPVPMREDGPDMDVVREYVENDVTVKGIWCVPKYANPTGVTYSDDVVRAFAALKPAAPDFRIFWDNAYAVHTFEGEGDSLLNIFDALAEQDGEKNLVYEFASTAKVTFPSSGMAWVTASPADMAELRRAFSAMRVSPEKISQLAHVRFLKDAAGVAEHMRKHAALVAPRFALVEEKLTAGLGELGVATWTHPKGGYFVSFEGPKGSAKAIVELARELGVTLTPAGAPWPYGRDPEDTNIRIAPTYPSLEELGQALDVFVVAVKLISARLARAERA